MTPWRPLASLPLVVLALGLSWSAACVPEREPGPDAGDVDDAGVDAGPLDGGVDAAAQVEALCESIEGRWCAALSSCDCRFDTRGFDEAGCLAARAGRCIEALSARVVPDITAGRARLDEAQVASCLAAVDALADRCVEPPTAALPECRALAVDVAAVGGDCQIEGGGFVYCGGGVGLCGPDGTCVALPGESAPCLGGSECAQGLTCFAGACIVARAERGECGSDDDCVAGLRCLQGLCAPLAGDGEACDGRNDCGAGLACIEQRCASVSLGETCRNPTECPLDTNCVRAPETRVCAATPAVGAACGPDGCGDAAVCDAVSGLCAALPIAGEPCTEDTRCADGTACEDGTRLCRALPGETEACFGGQRFCLEGLGCDEATQRCVLPLGVDGDPCVKNPPEPDLCAEGFGCAFEAEGSVCRPRAAPGSPCTNDVTCVAEAYCASDTCAPRLPAGAACPAGNECAVGTVCERGAGGDFCIVPPALDGPCVDACAEGLLCTGPGGECAPSVCALP